DLPIQQCWYPSDNATKTKDGKLLAGFTGADLQDEQYEHVSKEWHARDSAVTNGPGVFTASYTWEANAHRFMSVSHAERTDLILANLRKLHPECESTISDIQHFVWNEQSSPGYGAFAYFAPGEHSRYQKALCDAHPETDPRVFFAGEHLAIAHAWIQGAIQSSLNACIEVLQAPQPQGAST
ncbi:MAG TPA: FAD-dependent oxidoreductase, partial [Candidatus Paceibacterota bacterium]|nr:FAD-dependent oxidoreductase [Candidatus Paceibacterota bacterium]